MNINDIESFKLSDAVKFHDTLNPRLFTDERMQDDVREQLMVIAEDFLEFMGIDTLKVSDVRLYGSNAAYTYTKHSDLDLHILVDMADINNDEVYSELFNSKRRLYNDSLDITVRGMPVELYIQSSTDEVKSLGDYSVMNDRWVKLPRKAKASFDESSVVEKFKRLVVVSELALRSDDINLLDRALDTIRRYRKAGLSQGGEFSPENLAYKSLRNRGIVDKLYDHRDSLHSEELSIDEDLDVDSDEYTEIEFICANPQFPDATDPKLQRRMYNELKKIPGVLPVFQDQSEYSEGQMSLSALFKDPNVQPFIEKLANRLGVQIDLIQSRSIDYVKRAKAGELEGQLMESSGYIPSESERNDPRFSRALSVDVHPQTMKRQAKDMGLGNIARDGRPQRMNPSGKFTR